MSYTANHASALALLTRKGASVTFSQVTQTYVATAGTTTPATTTVAGYAVEVRGSQKVYEALSLLQKDARTLLFTPTTYGSVPALGASVSWSSKTYTVRQVQTVSPDGTAIICRVVVGR